MKLFLIVAFAAMAAASPANRVIDGEAATSGQFPWQVSLQYLGSHFCGGSVISNTWVLTAAHCKVYSLATTKVVLGITDLSDNTGATTVGLAQFTTNPKYGSPNAHSNDLAVIQLANIVSLGGKIDKIQLAAAGASFTGTATTSGWGYTKSGLTHGTSPNTLQWANLPLMNNVLCKGQWGANVDDTMVCAGGDGASGSCMGDSGGPLIVYNNGTPTLIGAVSWGLSTCNTDKPSVYASVAQQRTFIEDNTGL